MLGKILPQLFVGVILPALLLHVVVEQVVPGLVFRKLVIGAVGEIRLLQIVQISGLAAQRLDEIGLFGGKLRLRFGGKREPELGALQTDHLVGDDLIQRGLPGKGGALLTVEDGARRLAGTDAVVAEIKGVFRGVDLSSAHGNGGGAGTAARGKRGQQRGAHQRREDLFQHRGAPLNGGSFERGFCYHITIRRRCKARSAPLPAPADRRPGVA